MNSMEFIQQGKELMTTLRLTESEHVFQRALQLDPHSTDAWMWLGRISMIRDEDIAIDFFDRALQQEPNSAEALALKGVYWMKRKSFRQAIDLLEQAKSLNPDLKLIYFNLGKSYKEAGELKKAEETLRRAIEMDPDQFQPYSQLSSVLARTGRTKEAIQEMLKAIRINPLYVKGYLVVGSFLRKGGKNDLVIRFYESFLRNSHNSVSLVENHVNEVLKVAKPESEIQREAELFLNVIRNNNNSKEK